jgi:hypothetical protein
MTDLFNMDDKSEEAEIRNYLPSETSKYKSVEDLAKGKYESDRHIKNLERENADLRASNLHLKDDNVTKAKLEEYLDKITKATSAGSPPASTSTTHATDDQPLSHEKLAPVVKKLLQEHEVSKTKEQNVRAVTDALKERFGQNWQEALNKQTEELGLDKSAINYLAETSPKAFFKTLGIDTPPKTDPFTAPPKNSPHFAPRVEVKRTWSFYKDLKKNSPDTYNNPRTQAQMHQDYMKLGKDFEDGDFLSMGQESAF